MVLCVTPLCACRWTKQIKNVLKLDPDGLLKQGMHPTPDMEIEFWKSKAANLNAVFDQLQSTRIRKVLQFLESAKSTYCLPFARLCKEVFAARLEANDNVKYLRTLESWFSRLNSSDDFTTLVDLFKPMMHILLLIWKNSKCVAGVWGWGWVCVYARVGRRVRVYRGPVRGVRRHVAWGGARGWGLVWSGVRIL
jgi:hypothetical protein